MQHKHRNKSGRDKNQNYEKYISQYEITNNDQIVITT